MGLRFLFRASTHILARSSRNDKLIFNKKLPHHRAGVFCYQYTHYSPFTTYIFFLGIGISNWSKKVAGACIER